MNNVELNSDSNSSNEVFNRNRNNSNNIVNISENSVNISNFPNNEFYIYITL